MKEILELDNVYGSIVAVTGKLVSPKDTQILAERCYAYALECKNGLVFNENETQLIIERYTPPNPDLRKELWAIFAMYCFENQVFSLVNKYNTGDPEAAADICFATIILCARLYDPEKHTKFNTYVYTSMLNNIRRDNRNRFIRFPDKLAPTVAFLANNPEISDEDAAKYLRKSVRKIKTIREALRAQCLVSIDEQFDGDNNDGNGGTLASVLDSGEDLEADVCERESEQSIMTDFLPIIANIYGDDSAYVTLLRTGMAWGYQRTSFYKMEALYCVYLVTKKKLNNLADEIPAYADFAHDLIRRFATGGRKNVEDYVRGTAEEYLIYNLLNEAETEAHSICSSDDKLSHECFKPAGSLNYMFTKVFPVKSMNSLSDADRKQAARFRKELRDKGMDQIANAMFAAMKKSSN